MNCCQCQGIEDLFNEKSVSRELSDYRLKGPSKTTRMMLAAIKAAGVEGATLLDIGGGVGAIQHDLLGAGVVNAVNVDASMAYIRAAMQEAKRRGLADRIDFQHGNFVAIAGQIPPADIVTLDRVLCCYDDMHQLVDLSAARARKLYGLVYPRDNWLIKIGITIMNFIFKLQKSSFRTYAHSTQAVENLVGKHGLKRVYYGRTFVWQVVVYGH